MFSHVTVKVLHFLKEPPKFWLSEREQWLNENHVRVRSLTVSSKHSFLPSISRRVCRILMDSFSSLSINFLVCLISLTGWQEKWRIIYGPRPANAVTGSRVKKQKQMLFIDHHRWDLLWCVSREVREQQQGNSTPAGVPTYQTHYSGNQWSI